MFCNSFLRHGSFLRLLVATHHDSLARWSWQRRPATKTRAGGAPQVRPSWSLLHNSLCGRLPLTSLWTPFGIINLFPRKRLLKVHRCRDWCFSFTLAYIIVTSADWLPTSWRGVEDHSFFCTSSGITRDDVHQHKAWKPKFAGWQQWQSLPIMSRGKERGSPSWVNFFAYSHILALILSHSSVNHATAVSHPLAAYLTAIQQFALARARARTPHGVF